MGNTHTNDRLLGSMAPGEPARLLDEEEVERLVAEREATEQDEEDEK
jgi:hypothetical protein